MARKASSVGRKWESGIKDAVPDAIEGYTSKLPTMADAIIAEKAVAIQKFTASLNSANYDSKVRAGLAIGKADVAYGERLSQIAEYGLTDSSKAKMVEMTEVRRHLATLYPDIVSGFSDDAGDLNTPAGLSANLQTQILNTGVMQFVDYFNTVSTVNQVVTVLKANIASVDNLSISA